MVPPCHFLYVFIFGMVQVSLESPTTEHVSGNGSVFSLLKWRHGADLSCLYTVANGAVFPQTVPAAQLS